MSRFLLKLLVAWLAAFCAATALAQVPAPTEESVKAAFLVKFGSFVEWPAGTFARGDQPLVIGVAGDDALAAQLEQLASGRQVDGRPLAVRRLAEGAPASGVHILYVAPRRESRLVEALGNAAGPVLTVTSQAGALQHGSVINFSIDQGRVRFSASLASAEARNLKLSARLLTVAQTVEGRR